MTKFVRALLKRALARVPDGHKGMYGHVFVLAGSPGLTGAAYLSAMGALRSGAGLVTVGVPASLNPILEVKLTEAMTLPLPETDEHTLGVAALEPILAFMSRCQCLVIGPGLSCHPETQELVRMLVRSSDVPIVLDADGLNAYQGALLALGERDNDLVITPHLGEMARLMGVDRKDMAAFEKQALENFAEKYRSVVVLKGHHTVVQDVTKAHYINHTGNVGMATGGMGDVLSGMIGAFIGQGFTPYEAACLAVFIHGRAGDMAAKDKGVLSLLPTDLLNALNARSFSSIYITEDDMGDLL